MSRIFFHNFLQAPLIFREADLGKASLHLDAALSSFSRQACDPFSIASMSLAGFAGRIARVGILSTGAGSFLSQLGSVAAEAGTLTLWQQGNFNSHFVNCATFKAFSGLSITTNAIFQHFIQASAMVAGHQIASILHLEESDSTSFSDQFFEASITCFQIHLGSLLGNKISGNRLQGIEGKLEWDSRVQSSLRTTSPLNSHEFIFSPMRSNNSEGSAAIQTHSQARRIQMLAELFNRTGGQREIDTLLAYANPRNQEYINREIALCLIREANTEILFERSKNGEFEAFEALVLMHYYGNRQAVSYIQAIDLSSFTTYYNQHIPDLSVQTQRRRNIIYLRILQGSLAGAKNAENFLKASHFFSESSSRSARQLRELTHPSARTLSCLHDLFTRHRDISKEISLFLLCLNLKERSPLQAAFHEEPEVFLTLIELFRIVKHPNYKTLWEQANLDSLSQRAAGFYPFTEALMNFYYLERHSRVLEIICQRANSGDTHALLALAQLGEDKDPAAIGKMRGISLQRFLESLGSDQSPEESKIIYDFAMKGNPDALDYLRQRSRTEYYTLRALRFATWLLENRPR